MSTTATLAAYTFGKHRDGDVTGDFPMLRVTNVSHDPTLGTMAFTYRIRDLLVEKFSELKKKNKDLVMRNNRAMSKLTQEASNVLMKLSANNEILAQVENVFDGEDLRVKVTRTEMETICADLFERIRQPFLDIMVDVSTDSLQEVILMGGGTRIPKIQSVLIELSKKSELHKGVNSDEAAALGAVYQAAFHTPGFRVTRFIVKDYNLYSIAVDFMRAPPLSGDKPNKESKTDTQTDSSYIRQVLFPRGAVFPQKRAIKFNRHINDLDFYVSYTDLSGFAGSFIGSSYNISHVITRNVSKSAKQYLFAEPRGIKAHFTMDHNGILTLNAVSCIFHPLDKTETSDDLMKEKSTFEKIGNTLSGLFGGGNSGEEKYSEQDVNVNGTNDGTNLTDTDAANLTRNKTTTDNSTVSHNDDSIPGTKNQQYNIVKPTAPFPEPIDYEVAYVDFPELTSKELSNSRSKLNKLREADKAKAALEESINQLETLLIDTRDKISTDYAKYGTKDELEHLDNTLQSATDWFDETGHDSTKDEYDLRFKELKSLISPIEKRLNEAKYRPKAILSLDKTITLAEKTLNQMIELSDMFSKTFKAMSLEQQQQLQNGSTVGIEAPLAGTPWANVFTEIEIQTLKIKLMKQRPGLQDPPVLISVIQMNSDTPPNVTMKPGKEEAPTVDDDKVISEPPVLQKDESTISTEESTRTPRPEL
ncbi:unnamed protein product [Heterobilharzia americana]|nr:unnamed protein product [Heterobilharzia americana]